MRSFSEYLSDRRVIQETRERQYKTYMLGKRWDAKAVNVGPGPAVNFTRLTIPLT
jgi:hypothetical protein